MSDNVGRVKLVKRVRVEPVDVGIAEETEASPFHHFRQVAQWTSTTNTHTDKRHTSHDANKNTFPDWVLVLFT